MTAGRRPRAKGLRRVERWLVGLALAVVAFVLERLVMRTVKKKEPEEAPNEPSTRLTSKGGEVDFG